MLVLLWVSIDDSLCCSILVIWFLLGFGGRFMFRLISCVSLICGGVMNEFNGLCVLISLCLCVLLKVWVIVVRFMLSLLVRLCCVGRCWLGCSVLD